MVYNVKLCLDQFDTFQNHFVYIVINEDKERQLCHWSCFSENLKHICYKYMILTFNIFCSHFRHFIYIYKCICKWLLIAENCYICKQYDFQFTQKLVASSNHSLLNSSSSDKFDLMTNQPFLFYLRSSVEKPEEHEQFVCLTKTWGNYADGVHYRYGN
jgi:hypothetical protein